MSNIIKINGIYSEESVEEEKKALISLALEGLTPSIALASLSSDIDDDTFRKRVEIIRDVYSQPKFYTISDVSEMTGMSYGKTAEVFNSADFPSCDFGKNKIVEASALKCYFQKRKTNNSIKYIDAAC